MSSKKQNNGRYINKFNKDFKHGSQKKKILKKKKHPIKKWVEDLNRHSSKEDIRVAKKVHEKDAQCKLKLPWDITSHSQKGHKKSTNNKC